MGDDTTQDQNPTATETANPTVPSTDQPPVKTPSAQPTTETPQPAETKTEIPTPPERTPLAPTETLSPVSPPVLNIPALHYPFSGNFPVFFSFGEQSTNEEIKMKFQEWGIVGHNGLDFGLSAENEVYACDVGKVIQAGDNGDFGTSITIQHSWGQSIYAHLQETKVKEGDEVKNNQVIGLSGSSGVAFGEHLHFAIKPNNPDLNNGYLGFIDPASYLSLPTQKEEQKPETLEMPPPIQQETQKPEETKQSAEPVIQQPETILQQPSVPESTINIEPEKPVEQSQVVVEKKEVQKQVEDPELNRRVDERLKTELDTRREKANEARQTKREENLIKIEKLVEEKKQVNNDEVRELLHVSQSTATNYLHTLENRGTIKSEGKGKATVYHY